MSQRFVRVNRVTLWMALGMLAACGAPGSASAKKACHEEHERLSLTGHVVQQAFAGPPNYQSVRRGDAREFTPVLHLSRALCVRSPGVEGTRLKSRDLKTLQLLEGAAPLPSEAKQIYRVTGRLVLAEGGHHHLPVLLEVDDIEGLPKRHRGAR